MSMIAVLGLAAGFRTTVAFLARGLKTWQTRHIKDIWLVMFLVYVSGLVLWVVYGHAISDVPIMVANRVTFALAGTILYFKLRYGSMRQIQGGQP
jgi:MtN3 and saliva related transmembrane protein